MENPTSEEEDLREQLDRQEGVVEELRKKIKDEEGRISGYKEVLTQFQQRGNFVAPTSSAPFDKILQVLVLLIQVPTGTVHISIFIHNLQSFQYHKNFFITLISKIDLVQIHIERTIISYAVLYCEVQFT